MASKDKADFQRSSKDSKVASKDNADFQRSSKDSHFQEVLQDEGATALPAPQSHLSTAAITPPRVTLRLKRSQKVARKRWTILPMDSLEVTKTRLMQKTVGEKEPVNDIQKSKIL